MRLRASADTELAQAVDLIGAIPDADDRGPGLRSNSDTHGGFDDVDKDDPDRLTTMPSVQHMIAHGA